MRRGIEIERVGEKTRVKQLLLHVLKLQKNIIKQAVFIRYIFLSIKSVYSISTVYYFLACYILCLFIVASYLLEDAC